MQSCFTTGVSAQEQEQWLYGFSTVNSFEHIQMPHDLQDPELEPLSFPHFHDLLEEYKPFPLFEDQPVKEEQFEHHSYNHGNDKISEAWLSGSQVPAQGGLNGKSTPFQPWSKSLSPRAAKSGHEGQYMLKRASEIYRGIYYRATKQARGSSTCSPAAAQRTKEVASTHNHMIAERTRRKRERQHLDTLGSCIPSVKKKDKASVLQASIDYIQQLQCRVRDLELQLEARVPHSEGEEVNKSSESHQSFSQTGNPGSMVTQEDGLIPIQLGLETAGRQQQLHKLISMLTCVKDMGFAVYSLQWNPENSSKVDLTLQPKVQTKGAMPSSAQVQAALERKICSL